MNKQNSISLYNKSIFAVKETWFDSSFDILIGVYNIKIMIDMFEFLHQIIRQLHKNIINISGEQQIT